MRRYKLLLCLVLVCLMSASANALEFTVEPPEMPLFGKNTSIETVLVDNNTNRQWIDSSKNSALIPPEFGSNTSNLLFSGTLLTPNLVTEKADIYAPVIQTSVVEPTVTVTSTVPPVTGTGSVIGNVTADYYVDYFTRISFTELEDDMYYSGGHFATLRIPDIDLSVKVYEGTTTKVLAKGVGHFKDSSVWDGNVCLAAHNRGTNAYFEDIHNLDYGAEIRLSTKLGTRKYEVYSIEKISVDDTSDLQNTSDNIITLITCVKNQSDKYRWCVQAKEID